jgi:hypothetical protein
MKNTEKDSQRRFTLPSEKRKREHLNGHFNLQNAGSCFAPEFAADVNVLLDFINSVQPMHEHIQSAGTTLFLYELEETCIVGWEGIAERNTLENALIRTEVRNGYSVEVATVDYFPTTHRFCVVAQTKECNNELITAFPGRPAPPFPFEGQDALEKRESVEFWGRHVLLRKGQKFE